MKSFSVLADRLDKVARKFDERLEKKLEKTSQQIWEDVIANAPIATGNYISSIRIFPIEKTNDGLKVFIGSDLLVGPTKKAKNHGNYYNLGYLLEHGTKPHNIFPVDSDYLVFTIDGKKIFTKHVWHPGSVAIPHYSLALEKNKKLIKDSIKETWRQL